MKNFAFFSCGPSGCLAWEGAVGAGWEDVVGWGASGVGDTGAGETEAGLRFPISAWLGDGSEGGGGDVGSSVLGGGGEKSSAFPSAISSSKNGVW